MKKIIFFLGITLLLAGCSKNDDPRDDNPNLIDPLVNLTLNLSLPQYNGLRFPGNYVIVNSQGIRGIVIYNFNNDLYSAFDLSDPNHPPNSCSKMEVEGTIATCPCTTDDNSYFITSGVHMSNETLYPMQRYQAIRTGDVIRVTN